MTAAGTIDFAYAPGWHHPTAGMAARATPVGSEFNAQTSIDQVALTGLISANVDGDSIYKVTINETGASPALSALQKVATGIRNVAGMQFAANGDFYFADNAIDGPGADGDEPPQADELNRILAGNFGITTPDFGYPTCYTGYRTGASVGSGCVSPLVAFQPVANGTPLGLESEGPVEIVFAPSSFPNGYNNGVFVSFAGVAGTFGAANDENA